MYGFKKHTKGGHRQKFANGGMVRGPGTGTSDDIEDDVDEGTYIMPADSTEAIGPENLEQMGNDAPNGFKPGAKGKKIPVALSNGEFKLPPEQLQAIGQQVLDQMRAQTHTPAGMQPAAMETDEPRAFFADGGVVDDETRRAQYIDRFGTPQTMSADQTSALQNQNAAYVAGAQARQPAPAPLVTPVATPPAAVSATPAPAAKPVLPTEVEGWRTKAVMDGAAEDAKAAWDRGNVGEAAGAVARGAITAVPTAVYEFGANTVAPVAGFAKGVWNGLTGNANQPAAAAAPASPAAKPATPATSNIPAPAGSAAALASANPGASAPTPNTAAPAKPQGTTPAASQPAAAPAPTAMEISPGVYKQGRGQYSDNAAGMGFTPGFAGQPSARNMAAADALAARYGAPGMTAQAQQPTGPQNLTPKTSGSGFGILDQGYRDRRAAMMDAQQMKPGARTALAGLLKEQGAANERAGEAEQNAVKIGFQRGENALDRGLKAQDLAARREDAAANRGLKSMELQDSMQTNAVRREAAGFEVSAARQMQQLRDQYLNGKTPEERNAAAQKLQALSGKSDSLKDNFMVVGGGQEWDANAMAMRNVPQRVIDLRTGQAVGGGGQGGQQTSAAANPATRPVGTTSTVNGKTAVWDGQKWVPR